MPSRLITSLRLLAAALVTCSGVTRIGSLWFRELTEHAVLSLLVGAVYLIIAIGLFGQSRFTLFVAMLVPAATATLTLDYFSFDSLPPLQLAGITADAVTIACSAIVLWQLRNQPSR